MKERPYSGNPIDCVLPPLQAVAGIRSRERGDFRWQIMRNEGMIANAAGQSMCGSVFPKSIHDNAYGADRVCPMI